MDNGKHLMIDLETMGTKSHSVICSIAAVEFDLMTGTTGRTFNRNISLSSSLNLGLQIDASTLEWWMTQNQEAQKGLFKDVSNLGSVIRDFIDFVTELDPTTLKVWGNSARFDLGLLENVFHKFGTDCPWKHWNERDVRTLVSFAPEIKKNMPFEGVKHNALDDCYHQIKYCTEIYKTLKIDASNGL